MITTKGTQTLLTSLVLFSVSEKTFINGKEDDRKTTSPFKCNMYIAPSSIPNAGYGVYTTRAIPKGEPVVSYADTPSVITTDMAFHSENDLGDYWTHVDYMWSGAGLGEFEANLNGEVAENVFVLGCMSNFHTYLKNLKPQTNGYDDTYLDRYSDPGVGAFSYNEGHVFKTTRDVSAGEELFADYGEEWLDTREGTFADGIPRYSDYITAASVIDKLKKNIGKQVLTDKQLTAITDTVGVFDERVQNALPKSSKEYTEVISKVAKKVPLQRVLAQKSVLERNITWIEEEGICLELIKNEKSTIRQAGRGAFAQDHIKQGSIISPVPLNTIPNSDTLLMYELVPNEEDEIMEKKSDTPIGTQLILNYCFGHKESTMLLCPMTSTVLINHCSTRAVGEGDCSDKGPNAKIQWATQWHDETKEWLEKSLDNITDLTEEGRVGLAFEVVATRDIVPGEEVFIDYGENWEKAWEEHVEGWKPPKSTPNAYKPVKEMIGSGDFRTVEELETNPYADNVQLVCFFEHCVESDHEDDDEEDDEEEEKKMIGSAFHSKNGLETEDHLHPCEIVRKTSSSSFTVRVSCSLNNAEKYLVTKYPKKLITFRMKEYTSDQFLPGAFRHSIEIEDEIFPDQWRNRKVEV